MKRTALYLLPILLSVTAHAQVMKKYAISNSGCQAYFYCDPGGFGYSYSEDSSVVWTGECEQGEVKYGCICVKLSQPTSDLQSAEDLLVSYLDYLKDMFEIEESTGYGKGHRLQNREDTRGIIDYWKDSDGNQWKIKAWSDGKFIGVLYTYSQKELNDSKTDLYLNGFRFQGMK